MQAMFIKEMRQFLRSISSKISLALALTSWLMLIFVWLCDAPEIEDLKNMRLEEVPGYAKVFIYQLGIILTTFGGLLFVLGSSAGRWRLELGDPAFSPGVTTCTPAWKLALGKHLALMCQMLSFALISGVFPSLIFKQAPAVKVILKFIQEVAESGEVSEKVKMFCNLEFIWAMLCAIVSWGTMTLALCSLKPRSRGKFDLGAIAAMLVLAPQAFVLLAGISFDSFGMFLAARTLVSVVGGFALICSGVSAPASNRLFFFKSWMFVSVLVITPLLYKLQDVYSAEVFAGEVFNMGIFFIFASLFERLTQSRRVLTALSNPVWATLSFPFSTGTLNSLVLAGIFFAASWGISRDTISNGGWLMVFILSAVAAFVNMLGFFGERRAIRVMRLLIFCVIMFGFFILLGIISQREFFADLKKYIVGINVSLCLMILGFCAPLIKNYNYRKKHL